jgi:hypothetical protein
MEEEIEIGFTSQSLKWIIDEEGKIKYTSWSPVILLNGVEISYDELIILANASCKPLD